MTRSRRSQWQQALASLSVGALAAVFMAASGQELWAGISALVAIVVAWRCAPLHPNTSVSHWEAQERLVREDKVIIYIRPGCPFCLRLRMALGRRATKASVVDIWADDAAAAFVRDVNGGVEMVPTVILANGDVITNPSPAQVVQQLSA